MKLSLSPLPCARLLSAIAVATSAAALTACSGITISTNSAAPNTTRTVSAQPAAPAPKAAETPAAEGLKLARLLRDQARYEASAELYAQLEARGDLRPIELLEYATVAALVQTPQESLALFGRARKELRQANATLSPTATTALCNGLGRARAAMGQNEAALKDFDCTLAANPDDVTALNGKGVLLDALGQHEAARALLTHANELDPADARISNNLALSYLASGNAPAATRLLEQAAKDTRNPLWATMQLNLAFSYALQDRASQAQEALKPLMEPEQMARAMAEFAQMRQRIAAGASISEELLASSRQLLPLRTAKANRHG